MSRRMIDSHALQGSGEDTSLTSSIRRPWRFGDDLGPILSMHCTLYLTSADHSVSAYKEDSGW